MLKAIIRPLGVAVTFFNFVFNACMISIKLLITPNPYKDGGGYMRI